MTFGGSYASFDTPRFWMSVLLFSLAVPGLFEATKGVRWMNALGDLSYPVYLVHTMVLVLIGPWLIRYALPLDLLDPVSAGYVSVAAFAVVTTLAAVLVHGFVEVPAARAMKAILEGAKTRLS